MCDLVRIMFSVPTKVDGWRERIVLWKWFARSGEIGYQWRIWRNYFSWQSLSCLLRIAWTMLNIKPYQSGVITRFFNSIDWNFYRYIWGIQDPYKGGSWLKGGGWNIKGDKTHCQLWESPSLSVRHWSKSVICNCKWTVIPAKTLLCKFFFYKKRNLFFFLICQ